MKINLFIILFAFAFVGCKDNYADKSKRNQNWAWWINAKTGKASWIPLNKGNPVKDGKYVLFYFNGKVYEKGRLVDGQKKDTVFSYDIDGKLQQYQIFKRDTVQYIINNGPIKMRFSDGDVAAIGIVENHKIGGKWIAFYDNGRPEFERNLLRDTGWKTRYYYNGGVEDSTYMEGNKSFITTLWYDNGQLEQRIEFKNHNLNGMCKIYYRSGKLKADGLFVNGKANGEQKYWYESGNLQAIGHKVNGVMDGIQILYYENGRVQMEVNVRNGKRDGERKKYDVTGKLTDDKIFQNDHVIEDKFIVER